ncbi:DNA mismatch repair protein MutS [Acidobacteriota bacterium]
MVTQSEIRQTYQSRLDHRKAQLENLERRIRLISNLRLTVFVLGIVMVVAVATTERLPGLWLIFPACAFLLLVVIHDRLFHSREDAGLAIDFYHQGLSRIDHTWQGNGVTRDDFVSDDHPFARALDLFGKGSLYELLCTAWSLAGEETLARWLTDFKGLDEIRARQAAVESLRERLDFREQIVLGTGRIGATIHPTHLRAWGEEPPHFTGRGSVFWTVMACVMAAAGVVSLILWAATPIGALPLEIVALGELILYLASHRKMEKIHSSVGLPRRELLSLARLLERLETERFDSPKLVDLQQAFTSDGLRASEQIKKLERIVRWLDMQRNMFFSPMAFILMWGVHFGLAIERWRNRYGGSISRWFEAVGQFEALNAMASYAFEHPEDPFPVFQEGEARFEGESMGHPLMPDEASVQNSVFLNRSCRLWVVSGSNMAGKSTLLRVAGVNAVLAMIGAPVRAQSLVMSPMSPGSTIQIQDSLAGGTSRFFTEINRIRHLKELAREKGPLLFLLDELLHGTNSHDRKIGAESIIRGFLDLDAIGLLTTHDLALTQIAESLAPLAKNVHFDDRLEGNRLIFDYKLKQGVVKKSNALELMRSLGLTE